MAASVFNARLAQTNLITKADFDTKLSSLNRKILQTNQSIYSLKIEKLEKTSGPLFVGNISFDGGDGLQAYLIFQPVHRYLKIITNAKYISEWKSKGLSDESIKLPTRSDNSLSPLID